MKKIFVLPLVMLVAGCSGIAPEAVRDERNALVRPSFMKSKVLDRIDPQETQLDVASEK